ncbi:FCD domain-containing protein, partial [Klebsiella pneumoniae]|nr:FCD domain-containing protein [Klebsiella pneumoniae]
MIATCGNAAFDEVVRTFAPRLARLIHAATGGSVDAARRLLDGHAEICAQLAAGCAADAQRALQAHLDAAGTGVVVPGLPTGRLLGVVQAGVITGATLALAPIGSFSVVASFPPDVVTGSILGAALGIT